MIGSMYILSRQVHSVDSSPFKYVHLLSPDPAAYVFISLNSRFGSPAYMPNSIKISLYFAFTDKIKAR